ncbi:Amylopullulanase precursor [Paraliobacillus sp. PM-2]|uniref:glycoside hydrolase family 13 protein n=1 Tax=Paraliobacillus sp. PM-2 TaxID=1462524 RepID=UPI00061BE867|nr:glycoside hydrolase family 13 protein [Paraliobacillus sp. PM-2]CQR47113.1 Amylopullulanase precursor [Paraliobacillus sp. PM-2]
MTNWKIKHNSFQAIYRHPFGALPVTTALTLQIAINTTESNYSVYVHLIYEKEDKQEVLRMEEKTGNHSSHLLTAHITMPNQPQLIWYYFEIKYGDRSFFYGRKYSEESGGGATYPDLPPAWQITVYKKDTQVPKWWKHAIIYQIFPDRFYRHGELEMEKASNHALIHAHWDDEPIYIRDQVGNVIRWDFFGGNLKGIIEKLDYIQSLGVTVIYLNPIFKAESNHRYDTGDYHKIDPLLGTIEDLQQLIEAAKKRNIEIMLDGVFNHTGSNSVYFNKKGEYHSVGAYQSNDSPYIDWYTFYAYPDHYESWWGINTLPTLQLDHGSVQQFLVDAPDSVIQFWQSKGIHHWRLDVADELTDDFIRKIKKQLKLVNPNAVLLGEVWEDASNKVAYGKRRDYLLGDELDAVMHYPLRKMLFDYIAGKCDANRFVNQYMTIAEHYPKEHFYGTMNLLSSHDVERMATVLDNELSPQFKDQARLDMIDKQIRSISLFLFILPGVPSIYYGDEVGIIGGEDPANRHPFPWGKENNDRLEWFRKIAEIRNKYDALRTGDWKITLLNEDIIMFERFIQSTTDVFGDRAEKGHFIFIMNRHLTDEKEVTLPYDNGMNWYNLFKQQKSSHQIRLEPMSCQLFVQQD